MKLVPSTKKHLYKMMRWFQDKSSCCNWGGPDFRFPFSEKTFIEDAHLKEIPSYSLLSEDSELIAFGQYSQRENRCHLSRLIVAPSFRNQGVGSRFIRSISQIGCEKLSMSECSLFVLKRNKKALHLYKKMGFKEAAYPGQRNGLDNCLYMIVKSYTLHNVVKAQQAKDS